MNRWDLKPLESIGEIKFGMDREEVRKVLSKEYKEFKKTPFSKNTADDFGGYHVFYTPANKCKAVEIFEGVCVTLNGNEIFPSTLKMLQNVIPDLIEDDGSYISEAQSIGISVYADKVESILVGQAGYYARG